MAVEPLRGFRSDLAGAEEHARGIRTLRHCFNNINLAYSCSRAPYTLTGIWCTRMRSRAQPMRPPGKPYNAEAVRSSESEGRGYS